MHVCGREICIHLYDTVKIYMKYAFKKDLAVNVALEQLSV